MFFTFSLPLLLLNLLFYCIFLIALNWFAVKLPRPEPASEACKTSTPKIAKWKQVHVGMEMDSLKATKQDRNHNNTILLYYPYISCHYPTTAKLEIAMFNFKINFICKQVTITVPICTPTFFIPYTQVNKCIHLFPKLQGNICALIPNMPLIMKTKNWPHPKLRHFFDSMCTYD